MPASASARGALAPALAMLLALGGLAPALAGDPPRAVTPATAPAADADEGFLEFLGRGEDETAAFGETDGSVTQPAVQEDAAARKAKDERSGTGKAP
jgi:hypothetical protein